MHVCSECGTSHPKWSGQCSGCGDWNTLVEDVEGSGAADVPVLPSNRPGPTRIGDVGTGRRPGRRRRSSNSTACSAAASCRVRSRCSAANRASARAPCCSSCSPRGTGPTLYVTAEESAHQVQRRAERLGAIATTCGSTPRPRCRTSSRRSTSTKPELVVIDSIQTVHDPALGSPPGQRRPGPRVRAPLVVEAKERNVADRARRPRHQGRGLAGPRVLEHVVDTVLQFEGDRHHALRLLRASKHRFGRPTNSDCSRWPTTD